MTRYRSRWEDVVANDPSHSQRYIDRFTMLAAQGVDLLGEARFLDALLPRGGRVLDAGCGPGRHGSELARVGHRVVGVDIDPALIAEATRVAPGATWVVGDLADLPAAGVGGDFDGVLCAGNVMTFLHPATRVAVLSHLGAALAPTGRLVVGFGAGRGYEFDEFLADAEQARLVRHHLFSTWDLLPYPGTSGFIVALFGSPAAA
ncbi:class I SAM-dependent methyltransferase [Propionicicella superfundia]|uniref:class I SAM-dependent methyltransferase n=1 Tax=Propionicicella superfundia TaxID=348582 RepID=UPI000406969C|nr:class I SAM-dependent methyltransferase [Propionicicella superfundia]